MNNNEEYKKCLGPCGLDKPISSFSKRGNKCKDCRNLKKKEWRDKNLPRLLEKERKYNEENKDKLTAYKKEYNIKNKEKIAEERREYFQKTKDQTRGRRAEYSKEYRKNNKEKNS
jgi:hypothetical protein